MLPQNFLTEVAVQVKFIELPNEFALGVETSADLLTDGHDIASFSRGGNSAKEVAERTQRLTESGLKIFDLVGRMPGVDYVGFTGRSSESGTKIIVVFSEAYERDEMRRALETIFAALTDDGVLPDPGVAEEEYRRLDARKRIAVEWYPNERFVGLHFRPLIFGGVYRALTSGSQVWSDITPPALAQLVQEVARANGVQGVDIRPHGVSIEVKEGFSRNHVVHELKLIDRVQKAVYGGSCEVASFETRVDERDPVDDDWYDELSDDFWGNDYR